MRAHSTFSKFEPSISRRGLTLTAGMFWILGSMLLLYRTYAIIGLPSFEQSSILLIGVIVGALKSHFVLSKVAKKNVERIRVMSPQKEKICIFAFQPLMTYLLILIMIGLGITLRSYFPHSIYLAALYLGISSALLVSGIVYFRLASSVERCPS